MALTKAQKHSIVEEVKDLLGGSKMTVIARYRGIGVKPLQGLRRDARDRGTTVKVVKNRLVIQALKGSDKFKDFDTGLLEGMLLYAFNPDDEVAPAQSLYDFAKTQTDLEFIGALSGEGQFLDAASVKALAVLPAKEQLVAGLISTLGSPLQGIVSGLSGNLQALIQGLEAKAAS